MAFFDFLKRKGKAEIPADDFSIGQQPDGAIVDEAATAEFDAAVSESGGAIETNEPAAAEQRLGDETAFDGELSENGLGSAQDLYEEADRRVRKRLKRRKLVLAATAAAVVVAMALSSALYFGGALGAGRGTPELSPLLATANMQKVRYEDLPSGAEVMMQGSSVEEDLTVRVTDAEGAQITGFAFEFQIKNADDADAEVIEAKDEEMTGEIHIEGLAAGMYVVEMQELEDFQPIDPIAVEVAPKVEYKKIENVTVVKQSEVNSATDDPQYGSGGGAPAPPLTDTVEYVASRTEEKVTTTEKVVGVSYKPDGLGPEGQLLLADGTVSDVFAVVDANGYLTGAYRKAAVTPPAEGETPPEQTEVVQIFDPSGEPIKDAATGNYVYKIRREEIKETVEEKTTVYYGWQTLSGKTYYYDKNGKKVTGTQVIQGAQYVFNSDGSLNTSSGNKGIDVSTWQGNIDWAKVKASGISFVFIRAGFRGYGSGKIVEDDMFRKNMSGATAAGLKVGVYFFTQAINTREAVEEASAVLDLIRGYNVTYPIAIDIEHCGSSSGRTVNLTNAERTKICIAFCDTIRSAGYTPMIYANKNWFETMLNTSQFGAYKIWLAHFTTASQSSYKGRYDIWQHSSTGRVPGISGNVDLNISYMGY